MAGPSKGKVDEALENAQAGVEASQQQASLTDQQVSDGERARRIRRSHTAPSAKVSALAGYPVPEGAEHDAASEYEPKYRSAPHPDASEVKVKNGTVGSDVWEEVFPNNARTPSYVLRYRAGDTVNADAHKHHGESRRFGDFG